MSKHLRHRDSIVDSWSYDSPSRTVVARFSTGTVYIPVCTEKAPLHCAFFISRRGEDVWQIAPTRCVATGDGYEARHAAFDPEGIHCEFIQLTNAPESTSRQMEELYFAPALEERPTMRTLKTPKPWRA